MSVVPLRMITMRMGTCMMQILAIALCIMKQHSRLFLAVKSQHGKIQPTTHMQFFKWTMLRLPKSSSNLSRPTLVLSVWVACMRCTTRELRNWIKSASLLATNPQSRFHSAIWLAMRRLSNPSTRLNLWSPGLKPSTSALLLRTPLPILERFLSTCNEWSNYFIFNYFIKNEYAQDRKSVV